MLKETKEKLFCHVYFIGNILIGARRGGGNPGHPGYAYGQGAQAPQFKFNNLLN